MTERIPMTTAEAEAVFDRLMSGEWVDEQDIEAAATALPDWEPPALEADEAPETEDETEARDVLDRLMVGEWVSMRVRII